VPFFAAGALAIVNFLFGLVFLRESLEAKNRRPFVWRRANAFSALKALRGQSSTVLWFVGALGVWMLAHTVYPSIWTYFAMEAYGFDARQVGLALAMVGLTSALVQGLGLRYLGPMLGERGAVLLGVAGFAASAVLYVIATNTPMVYLAITVGALQGLIQPSIQAINSRAVDARSQGELQGATQSIGSIASILAPPLYAGVFAKFSGPEAIARIPAMPLLLAAGFSVIALGLFVGGLRRMPARAEARTAA
jgi:DHA1 family tetracycline resistance protein-like MFS transporter